MFGFGNAKKYREKVWHIVDQMNGRGLLPSMAPLNSEIEKFRLNKFKEHEAILLLFYSSALSVWQTGNKIGAQSLYDLARDNQDSWVKEGFVDAETARGFNSHISENSGIRVKI